MATAANWGVFLKSLGRHAKVHVEPARGVTPDAPDWGRGRYPATCALPTTGTSRYMVEPGPVLQRELKTLRLEGARRDVQFTDPGSEQARALGHAHLGRLCLTRMDSAMLGRSDM